MRLSTPHLPTLPRTLSLGIARRSSPQLVGLDIQPGLVAAVKARVNGSIVAEHAAALALPPDAMRDGEVTDHKLLTETLRELFDGGRLGRRVRVGVANQRTVLRILELPPVTDSKDLAAAVSFQAQEQVPMPLSNAVLDFQPLGLIETPAGPRQRVVLVAAQRDMVERLLGAVRAAGLSVEGVDLSAFALIRSLYRPELGVEHAGRVLYLNVDGLTNLAIAEGTVCRFTRVIGSGLEGIASQLAERNAVPLTEARAALTSIDLRTPAPEEAEPVAPVASASEVQAASASEVQAASEGSAPKSADELEERERAMSFQEMAAAPEPPQQGLSERDVRAALENGIRALGEEVRNSLEFHGSQDGGGEVSHVVLSGSADDIPGFAEALQAILRVEVRVEQVNLLDSGAGAPVSSNRLAVATGLSVIEAPQ